jgi:hypothetical protein
MKARNLYSLPLLLLTSASFAQGPRSDSFPMTAIQSDSIQIQVGGPNFGYVVASEPLPSRIVKGAPYSADIGRESIQVLTDGNRIVHTSTAHIARDSDGRTRREQDFESIPGLPAEGSPEKFITIQDPVNAVNYVLDSKKHVAFKNLALPALPPPPAMAAPLGKMAITHTVMGTAELPPVAAEPMPVDAPFGGAGKTESLGTQTIAGVEAEGTQTTNTIPAGSIGNEKPIEITTEKWFSKELQIVMLYKRSDPRFGEMTYKVKALQRTEPPKSEFEVPADYHVQDSPPIFSSRPPAPSEFRE